MGYRKSNFGVYSSFLKADDISKRTDISNILKRNKIEEQKEKVLKFFALLGSSVLALLVVIFIFL